MYSYEGRIRAVELCIKLGTCVRPTTRHLGYPTKSALQGWCRKYEQRLDLPVGVSGDVQVALWLCIARYTSMTYN